MAESTLDGGNAHIVASGTDLSEESLEIVGLEPVCGCGKTLDTNGGGDTSRAGTCTKSVIIEVHRIKITRAVRIEILVHLNGEIVSGVSDGLEGIAISRGDPSY